MRTRFLLGQCCSSDNVLMKDYKKLAGRPAFQDLMMHMERRGNDR